MGTAWPSTPPTRKKYIPMPIKPLGHITPDLRSLPQGALKMRPKSATPLRLREFNWVPQLHEPVVGSERLVYMSIDNSFFVHTYCIGKHKS